MQAHSHGDLSVGVNTPIARGYGDLHRRAAPHWASDRGVMPPHRHSADDAGANVEPIGIRALRKWERAQKGLDPASAAILSYLISVSTHGKTKLFQATIADRTGVGIATVRRRLPLLAHLGLISRVSKYGAKGRAADEFRLNTVCTVHLDHDERDALIRRFNRRDAFAAKPSLSPTEPDAVSTTVVLTVSEHSSTGSVLSPVSGSEQAQNLRAVGEPSGCHASATPPIAEPGDPVFSMVAARPNISGIGDDDFEDAGAVYGDDEGGTLTDGGEFDDEERPEPHRQAVSPVTAEPDGFGPDELPLGLCLSPVEQHRAARAWARGERYTPPTPRSRPMAPVQPEATADRREHHTRLWCDLLPRIAEMTAKNGIVMSNAALRSRLGKLIKEHGAFEASKLVTHCLDAEPGGDPLTYVEGIRRGRHDEEERGRRGMTDEIDYR